MLIKKQINQYPAINRQAGFVLTLEFILIITILGIGLLVGIVAVRNALIVHIANKKSQQVYVYDSSDPPLHSAACR